MPRIISLKLFSRINYFPSAHEFDARRRMISKTFYQQLRSSERQSLLGPPESMREHVVAASKAMRNGNWFACFNFIINDKMNAKVILLKYIKTNCSGYFKYTCLKKAIKICMDVSFG